MLRLSVRAVAVGLATTLIFEAGAVAPAFVLAGEANGTGQLVYGWPQIGNSVPLAISQPVAPVHIEGVPGLVVPGLGATVRPQFSAYTPPATATEVANLRSEFGRVIANPDGTFTAEYNAGRINFRDAAGTWNPIDLTLVSDGDATYGLHTAANSFEMRVNAHGSGRELAELQLGGTVIRLRQLTPVSGPPAVSGGAAHFPAPQGNGAVSIIPMPEGLQFNVSLDDATRPGTYHFVLDTGGLRAEPGPDGHGVRLVDALGAVVATVSPPSVFDALELHAPPGSIAASLANSGGPIGGPPATPVPPSIPVETPTVAPPSAPVSPAASATTPAATVTPGASPLPSAEPTASPTTHPTPPVDAGLGPNEVLLSYTIDPAWLHDPARAFPVTLDPTICIQKGQTVEPNGCDDLSSPTGYLDHFVMSGLPGSYPYGWDEVRVGYDTTSYNYEKQRALFYFPNVVDSLWDDGFELVNAKLVLKQSTNTGSNQQIRFELVTKGWTTNTTWNSQPTTSATEVTPYAAVLSAAQVPDYKDFDVTKLVRHWYTHNLADWKPNLGLMARMQDETNDEVVHFRNKLANVDNRPRLALTYVVPKVNIAFDTATLGPDFAPSVMPAGATIALPVKVTNNGSGFSFPASGNDYYALGYRWFDATGAVVATSGLTSLPVALANNATSDVITLPVAAPASVGQYRLRLDLVHVVTGADNLWASDWALPTLYYSGAKASSDPANTRIVGSSVVQQAEFGVAVVGGGGTAMGQTQNVGLADGSALGINLWSRNLRFDGAGGPGFADLGSDFGLSYFYDSANRTDCSGILKACGWGTNFDESFRPGVGGSDYVYVDDAGNRYLVSATAAGQLVSSAGVRLERMRHTILEENWMNVAWGTAWAGAGNDPVISTTYSYNSSGHSYRIGEGNAGTATSSFTAVDLDHYPLVSFAVRGASAASSAIGFEIVNQSKGTTGWLAYTVGTDFSISGVSKIALGGSISSWTHTSLRDLRADAVTKGLGTATERLSVKSVKLWGGTGSGGNVYFDSVRLQGRESTIFDDAEPGWTTNGGQAAPYDADKVSGSYSMQALPQTEANSANCTGTCFTNLNLTSPSLTTQPFVTWSWRKVGGSLMAIGFHVKDTRSNATGTITYYAGPKPNPEPAGWIQISDIAPTAWTTVMRNLLDDAREKLGFFDNYGATFDSEDETQIGPQPDPVDLTGFRLIGGSSSTDGKFALFDLAQIHSLTNLGADYSDVQGDDFVVTLPGNERHFFNRDGMLLRNEDGDGNATVLDWTYDFSAYTITLDKIHAPSDGMSITGGTADRELDVTYTGSTLVKVQEILNGVTGRYAEFTRDGSNNLTSVVPARRSAACAGSGASGCLKFQYETGTSLLNRVIDPRDTGSPYTLSATVTWSGSPLSPTKITSSATSTDLLRIHSWGDSSTSPWRMRWQDADGIAGSGNGYARHLDMTPNGSVLVEYRPLPCADADCGSGGVTSPSTPTDKLVEYLTDGINNYSSETHYRLTGNGGAVTSRRGSFAAASVDNLIDPLGAQLTPWTQTAAQYAASVAASNPDLYRTNYTYNADGLPIRTSNPYANMSGSVATQTVVQRYDSESHLIEASDNAFLANGGFESGLDGWTNSGASWEQTTIKTGIGSLKVTGSNSANQIAQLLPGQTFRFQVALKATTGSATYQVDYERASDSSWQTLLAPASDGSTSWKAVSYDLSIPNDGTGRVKVILKIASGSGTVYFDDVVALTTFTAASYTTVGQPDINTDVLDRQTNLEYAATTAHPAIFVTSTIANYKSGQGATVDQNVTSYQTYNAWGLPLVSTDPDGVATTTVYASNKTDVASVADGLGNTTSFTSYDAIGQLLTTADPLSRSTTTTYDWFGNPIDETDFAGVVTHSVYDGVGRATSIYANWVSGGSGTSGVNNVRTTYAYDEYGQVTRMVADAGVSAATSDATYDLLGNKTSETVYPDGTSNGRTTTTYFGAAGLAVGSSGPIVPTASGAPSCPGAAGKCNTVTSVDMNGRATVVTDAYGKQTLTWNDFAGKPVRQVLNYVSGGSSTASQNVTTTTRYDVADRVVAVTDPLNHTTSTTYDNLDRITKVTRPDLSWTATVYRASGRVDMESRPTDTVGAEIWTKHVYDAAGRQVKTIDHYDTSGTARLWLTPFEAGADGWSSGASGYFTAAATSATSATTDGFTGARGLTVVSGTASNAGTYLNVSGSTFKSGHAYRMRARVKGTSGTTLQAFLGVDASASDYASSSSLAADGTWQVLDLTWTPTADRSTNVHLAIGRSGTSNVTFYVDDVIVWDNSSAAVNPSGPDWNIPTETVYDAAGRITASVMVPGDPATDGAFVTLTTYTTTDQVASVRAAATPAWPATSGELDIDLRTIYAYDALGNQTDVTDPTGVTSHYDFDRRGNIVASTANYVSGGSDTASQNVKAMFAYDDLNELLASCAPKHVQAGCDPTTPSSTAWRYTYDQLGHTITTTPPANTSGTAMSASTTVYDTASGGARVTRVCDHPAGGSCSNSTRYIDTEYDALSRVTKVTNFTGIAGSGTEALRTESTFDAASEQTAVTYYEAGTQKDALTFAYDSIGRQTVTSRGGNAVTTSVYNVLGKVTSRTDHAISSTASTFTYDWRGNELAATSPTYSGSTTFAWRLDGLIASRTWPTGTNAATFAYDRSKRPVTLSEKLSGSDQAVFTQAYDRAGVVTAEGRTLSGVSGIAGSGSQTFTFDPLHRVTGSSISGGPSQTFGYDANSNRTSWNDGSATTTYDYNESDELTAQHRSGVDSNYTYDAYGNMTTSAVTSAGATTYTYDAQDRVTSITPPSGGAIAFTLDALGRHWTKSIGGTLTDTYGYVGASEAIVRIDQASASISSAVDAAGNRVAVSTSGGGFGWLLPNLHGDVAGAFTATGSAISDAFRYNAYGTNLASTTSSLPSPWRFQGRLALNSDDGTGVNTDLYDFVARAYDPNLGAFTSLDTVAGGAQNPLTLNRFLYALANPTTLIDPDGHEGECGLFAFICDTAANAVNTVANVGNFGAGFVQGVLDAGSDMAHSVADLGIGAVHATSQAFDCARNDSCRNNAMAAIGNATANFVRDPVGSIQRGVDAAGNGLAALAAGVQQGAQDWLNNASRAWDSGDYYSVGRSAGQVAGTVASSFIPVAGLVGKAGAIARWIPGLTRVGEAARPISTLITRAANASSEFLGAASNRFGSFLNRAANCAFNSFSADTVVATTAGAVAISTIAVGDEVLAHDEASGTTANFKVTAVHVNDDPVTGVVIIDGEVIETTPEHPFYTMEAGWVEAQNLEPGTHVPASSGAVGTVQSVHFSDAPATMYNLTVEDAHTFFVGEGQWLVHNRGCVDIPSPRVNRLDPDLNAGGAPHTVFRRDPNGTVTNYTTYGSRVQPNGTQIPELRFRGTGRPHANVDPPFILEPRRPGSRPVVPRPALPFETPRRWTAPIPSPTRWFKLEFLI